MAINLQKGQKIDLRKSTGESLTNFCVGVNWGAIETIKSGFLGFGSKKVVEDVDLDLSCIMLNANGDLIDWLYSPDYNAWLSKNNFPLGKLSSKDGGLRHSGDDRQGDVGGDDGLDNEIISVDLNKVSSDVDKIFFFLNIYLNQGQNFDFAQIPFAKIRMYEGTPTRVNSVYSNYDIVTDSSYTGKGALILGKLYRKNSEWKFDAIGDPADDKIFVQTIQRIIQNYK
ncbi:TerD family protein [Empedobacter falsenii]|uniref:Stress response protein SCP2 n=1 Tax=Empedobacter falsenii TaxID=343874 RepID=A0A376GHH4_9FLAO|nr:MULTISPECIES: TerD family protein [Empedobacter]MDH0674252.1 TerD family protein [Empedobacter sp. GD03861]MDH2208056.1 TerD family protein [Empedobacter sp. GD03644]STD58812.1 Stress response protein SCP2 [Empedobacter falsenii]HAR72821.1 Tellurium resistance protein TerD [Flavobacteriaceae bacterium]